MRKHLTHIVITSIVALIAVPVCGVAVAVAASGTSSTSAKPSSAGTPRCSTSQLHLSLIDHQGALGTTYWDMALRNLGRSACHMRGYPGVGLLDPDARLINVLVVRNPVTPVRTITLAPGQQAYFTFGYPSNIGACARHFNAFGVQIIPPNEYQRIVLPASQFEVCTPSHAVGNPRVLPLRTGLRV
ncbi:MAG: DUF4232 domain-containing protein [Actinomycetota bacterium]|nr:DUF4232 domain-containing protein [Actinomycetota bacterium]